MSICRALTLVYWILTLSEITVCVEIHGPNSERCSLADDVSRGKNENWTHDKSLLKLYQISGVKISATSKNRLIVVLSAYERNFTLYLHRDYSIFHTNLTIAIKDDSGLKKCTEMPRYYSGFEESDNSSWAHGEVESGCFNGVIHTSQEIYYVEPAIKHFPATEEFRAKCLVYRVHDIDFGVFQSCNTSECDSAPQSTLLNNIVDDSTHIHGSVFRREARSNRNASHQALSCTLNLVADHLFFQNVGQNSVSKTISEIAFQVKEADAIFRSTDIDGDGASDNIGFVISGITVYTSVRVAGYKMADDKMGDLEYLERFSEYDFSGYCLAIAFTFRDFDKGVIGLAWVGHSNRYSSPGGICQQPVLITPKRKIYSFNTALVTFVNYGIRIPRPKSVITLCHEFGHNFGSPHDKDNEPSCAPGGEDGNFIMYPYATDGSKPNHKIFSSCSVKSMNPVIINKGSCLIKHPGPVCGNRIPEGEEECDCGDAASCSAVDPCCTPSDAPNSGPDPPCTFERTKGKICSPKVSTCCTGSCQLITNFNYTCSQKTDCKLRSTCDGVSANCPDAEQKPNGTLCSHGQRFCHLGECQTSLCKSYGLTECMCTANDHLCVVCCRTPTGECRPMDVKGNLGGETGAFPGQPCKNYLGYCNKNGKCILIDSDSMLDSFEGMFSSSSIEGIRTWFRSNWFYVVIGCFSLVLLVAVFVVNIRHSLSTHVLSKRMGKLVALLGEIEKQKERVSQKMVKSLDLYDRRLSNLPKGKSLDMVVAVSRIMMLFPTVPKETILQAVRFASCEEVAVKHLLLLGYPQIRILYSEKSDNPRSVEEGETSSDM